RAAYALQQKALGPNDPNTAVPLMLIALQLSDQGRTIDAAADFNRAARLVGTTADPLVVARLQHYRALNAINENQPAVALPLLRQAEHDYMTGLSPDLLTLSPPRAATPLASSRRYSLGAELGDTALIPPDQQAALIGVIETRRYQAIALRELGRNEEAHALLDSATRLSAARGLHQRDLTARLARTTALISDAVQAGSGLSDMDQATRDFEQAQPGTRPVAQTLLLRAAQALHTSDATAALPLCRRAAQLLTDLGSGTDANLLAPCLDIFAAAAAKQPADREALLGEMFGASQLAQGSITSRQIALASARLTENAKNPRVGEAIRRQQDASLAVADLQSRIDLAAADAAAGRPVRESADTLAKQLSDARSTLADADAVLQAAAPNYGQLIQQVATAAQVLGALAPNEAFVSMALTANSGWVFVLRDGKIDVARSTLGGKQAEALVGRIRKTVDLGESNQPPPFDVEAARTLYAGLLGPVEPLLKGAESLTVVPVGALLSIPFEVLLTGPADPANLAAAPWLMQRFAITHVPAPANFVSLRRVAATAAGAQPWFGFGDFRPVTVKQAAATFPTAACADSARLFAGLPLLPFAGRELTAARQIMGAPPNDELLGPAFTTPAVLQQDLRGFRVLHFATHALLPTDLRCQTEPAIVTSGITGAPTANAALLTASDVTGMQLDADVVILSACNSGGPNGATSGESLSGLARAFFYAGARAMLVTHWSVNDQATALLVAGTLARLRAGDPLGLAGAFQKTQQSMLADAGKQLPAVIAHPFYWAPFALVGEGRGRTRMAGL
ncbi:MAG: CHAT domain-containing protein, partial [Acetobacteraceae bacterium]|nr:CHAT domain-containing protein [Acetobacteraceae bacterium]